MRLMDKVKAIGLRRKGYAYFEIMQEIPFLSKSTLSGWVKNIELTNLQKNKIMKRIKSKVKMAQVHGAWANRDKWQKRIDQISIEAQSGFSELSKNPLFLIGLSLYWAEGSKRNRRFQFINSDPKMIQIMMRWLREIHSITDDQITARVYMHDIYKNEHCEDFWSGIIGIPLYKFKKTIFKPTLHKIKRNLSYKGCCRIEVLGSELFWKVMAWQKMLSDI